MIYVTKDGNCLFWALKDQLQRMSLCVNELSAAALREQVVNHMRMMYNNPADVSDALIIYSYFMRNVAHTTAASA